jgi:hypothetical protein
MIIGAAIIWTGIVPTIVGVIVTEIIEYKRKRERDSEAYTVGAGRQRGEDQRGSKEQKDQRLFHLRCTSRESFQLIRNQMKREARRERRRTGSSGIERHRTGLNGVERDRAASSGIERDRTASSGIAGKNETAIRRVGDTTTEWAKTKRC